MLFKIDDEIYVTTAVQIKNISDSPEWVRLVLTLEGGPGELWLEVRNRDTRAFLGWLQKQSQQLGYLDLSTDTSDVYNIFDNSRIRDVEFIIIPE